MAERWTVIGDDSANLHVVDADDPNMRVCFLTSDGPTERRARLIAAAPDLLEALTELLAMLREYAPGTTLNNHSFDALGIKCNDAIAKAGG